MYYLTVTLNGKTDTIPWRSLITLKRAIKFYESLGATMSLEYRK